MFTMLFGRSILAHDWLVGISLRSMNHSAAEVIARADLVQPNLTQIS